MGPKNSTHRKLTALLAATTDYFATDVIIKAIVPMLH